MASIRGGKVRDEERQALVEERRALRKSVQTHLKKKDEGCSDKAWGKAQAIARCNKLRVRQINAELEEPDEDDDKETL